MNNAPDSNSEAELPRLYRARTGETIEARQFLSSPAAELEILTWAKTHGVSLLVEHDGGNLTQLRIPTTGGDYIVKSGDWVIRDNVGGFRPCGPRMFEATYKAVA
jgi:hypothetical protein